MAKKVSSKKVEKVSSILYDRRIDLVTSLPHSKTLTVVMDDKRYQIPKNKANLDYIKKSLGRPSTNNYRGKNRKIWSKYY